MGSFLSAFEPVIMVIHFLVAFFMITAILLQAGKGTDIGTMFGAGSSGSLFGARGAATLLSKITTGTAVVFLLTSLSLATIANYTATGGSGSVITEEDSAPVEQPATSAPADAASVPAPAPDTAPAENAQ